MSSLNLHFFAVDHQSWQEFAEKVSPLFEGLGLVSNGPTLDGEHSYALYVDTLTPMLNADLLRVVLSFVDPDTIPEALRGLVAFRHTKVLGGFTPEVSALIESFTSFTSLAIESIINVHLRIDEQELRIEALSKKVDGLTIYNHEVVNHTSVYGAIQKLAEKLDMSIEEIFPTQYHKVH